MGFSPSVVEKGAGRVGACRTNALSRAAGHAKPAIDVAPEMLRDMKRSRKLDDAIEANHRYLGVQLHRGSEHFE